MADPRRFEPDEFLIRPGTYFNPHTEVLIVVDDSPELDADIFSTDGAEGAEWVLISDEVPVDEHQRDELIEAFQIRYHPAGRTEVTGDDEDEDDEDEDELEADELE
jgi:hypothetical protein